MNEEEGQKVEEETKEVKERKKKEPGCFDTY